MRRALALFLTLALLLGETPLKALEIVSRAASPAKPDPAAAHLRHIEFQQTLGAHINRLLTLQPGQGLAALRSLALFPAADPVLAREGHAAQVVLHLLADPEHLRSNREHLALTLGRENVLNLEAASPSLQNDPQALAQLTKAQRELSAAGVGDLDLLIRKLDAVFSGSEEMWGAVLVMPSGPLDSKGTQGALIFPSLKPSTQEKKQESAAPPAPAAPSLVFPEHLSTGQALELVLGEALKPLPGGRLARTLRKLAQDHGHQFSAEDLKALYELTFAREGRKAALTASLLKSLLEPSAENPEAREALTRALWAAFRLNAQAYLKSPEQYWISHLERKIKKALPSVQNFDTAFVKNKELFRGMDEWVPILFWMDPETQTAHLRIHQTIIDYIFSSDGKRKLKDFGWKSTYDLIPVLVERITFQQGLAGQINPATGKTYTSAEALQALLSDPGRKLDQQRLEEIAGTAAANRLWRFKFLKWQLQLALPLLPYSIWSLVPKASLAALYIPPAGLSLLGMALAVSLFLTFAWLGPVLYKRAVAKGWIAGEKTNVIYAVMLRLSWPVLLYAILLMAYMEEALFRLSFFTGSVQFLWHMSPLAAGLFSTLSFAILHIPNLLLRRMSKKEMLGTFLYCIITGVVFALVYWFGGFLLAGLLHTIYNIVLIWKAKTHLRRPEKT